jgi:hypothetical protein
MTKSRSNAVAPAAKGQLVVGTGTDASTTLAVASTAGYVLTVDSAETTGLKWAAPATGSLVKLNTTTLSSASTVTISNIFTSTYDNYMILWSQSGASANYAGVWQLTVSGTATNTNYYSVTQTANGSNTYAVSSWSVTANPFYNDSWAPWYYTNGTSQPADSPAAVTYLFNPNKARATTMVTTGYGNNGVYNLQGTQTSSTQFDGFKWTPNGPTVSGTITVYGIEK